MLQWIQSLMSANLEGNSPCEVICNQRTAAYCCGDDQQYFLRWQGFCIFAIDPYAGSSRTHRWILSEYFYSWWWVYDFIYRTTTVNVYKTNWNIGLNVLSMLAPNIGLRAHIFDHHLSTCITSVCIWIQLVDCCQCWKFRHRYRYDWKFNSETTNDNKWIPSSDKTSVETPCASILTPLIQTEYKNTIHEQQFYWLNESLVSAKNTHAQAHHTIYM